jgi:hypothetical protein
VLPPRDIKRWTIRRKAEAIAAIAAGLITVAAAGERWQVSREELEDWQRLFAAHGLRELRATRVERYGGRRRLRRGRPPSPSKE